MEIQFQATAHKYGFNTVHELKKRVAMKIKEFIANGGFMFAMCSATDSFDIALSADGVDICEPMFDGDASEAAYQSKIDYRPSGDRVASDNGILNMGSVKTDLLVYNTVSDKLIHTVLILHVIAANDLTGV